MMERVRENLKGCYCRRVITYFLACCLILNTSLPVVLATPTPVGDGFTVGTGSITAVGDATNVVVDQLQSVIEWSSLDTMGNTPGPRESLNFSQGGLTNSAVLNRVSGAATQFDGDLSAMGMRIFIVNPAGIVFGEDSIVNVTQLVASGLNMSNDDFMAATRLIDPIDLEFEGGDGTVMNESTLLRATDSIVLVGKKVINNGFIGHRDGLRLIVMAAGDNVYVAQDGSNVLVELESPPLDDEPDISNGSYVYVGDGDIVLAAGDTFSTAYSRTIENVAFIRAPGGTITAQAGNIINHGLMDVRALSSVGDGGSINLTASEDVLLAPPPLPSVGDSQTLANAGDDGAGGTITIEAGDTVTIGENASVESVEVQARGGSDSGDGGHVKITADHFVIAGDVDASPGNTDYEPGTLEIDPADVTIADGANLGAVDTLYEEDIETMSDAGTSVIVYADDSITVEDIDDGEITGRFGSVELYATGTDSIVSFDDVTDTIRTSLGDIIIEAGSGGITAGNLITDRDSSDEKPTPGHILLTTENEGDISTGDLIIERGWGPAVIDVDADGYLTVDGDVIVGKDNDILSVPDGESAQASVLLSAGYDVTLNGDVGAYAHGTQPEAEDATIAEIRIFAGTNEMITGDVYVNGDIRAEAQASAQGTSEATIEINAWGEIIFGDVNAPYADADQATVQSFTSDSNEVDNDLAQIIINAEQNIPQLEGLPDSAETHMNDPVGGNVLDNDVDPEEDELTADLVDGPSSAASFSLDPNGSYSYLPEEGFVGEDSFTYTATDGVHTTESVLVTITVTNDLPELTPDAEAIHMNDLLEANVLDNDLDPDGDPFEAALVDGPSNAESFTLNPDGSYSYEPTEGFVGEDTFTYETTDGQLDGEEPIMVEAVVTITVGNDLPEAVDDTAATQVDNPVSGNVLTNDTDPDDDPLSVVLNGTLPENGEVTLNPDGSFTYTPDEGFVGEDSFTYQATDGQIDGEEPVVDTATVTITVTAEPPEPEPEPAPVQLAPPATPGLERVELEVSGCPALLTWVANELEVDERMMDVWVVNALASTRGIQPCDTCASLKQAAIILQDAGGTHIAALAQVISEFASSTAPPTEEQMASIADAIANNVDEDNVYAVAGEYLDALAEYIGILYSEMGFSAEESVEFATDKYVGRLTESGNVGAATYVAAILADLAE
jgi:filamentous hemagglutinin family protein